MEDITKTGSQSYRELQNQNKETFNYSPFGDGYNAKQRVAIARQYEQERLPVEEVSFDELNGFGESKFDKDVPLYATQNLEDWRGRHQSAIAKWGSGLAKGIGLAGTTFLDGTLGLIYGVAQGATEGRWSGLWDNDVSNALHEINKQMETILPNYRTQEEQERPWYQNIGTANFWADGVLKNLGFTVGAFYSGGAWTKGLQAIGLVKQATSAQVIGSFLSGLNEGRIEATNNTKDWVELQNKQLQDARDKAAKSIALDDRLSEEQQIAMLKTLDGELARQQASIQDRADAMGMTTLIGNTILLSLDNLWQFGKLYSRGFENAKSLSKNVENVKGFAGRIEAGMAAETADEITKEGGKYVGKTISKKEAIAKGLSNGLVEGNEEMSQALISEYAGNKQSYDSPDAYYKALVDPNARLQTKDTLTALAEGLANTYGNGDKWEEFAIGAFTGLLGMPTFGKVNNSDANTYLGRGKSVGLSGGVLGEYKSAMAKNKEITENVEGMNKYLDKLKTRADYFAQSQSFTNTMDGWAEAQNEFEFKNARDNDDFSAVSRFARAGKLQDLKDLVNQDFENMSDERLADIAGNTTPNVTTTPDGEVSNTDENGNIATGGWRNADGTLMSDTSEGRQQMREELANKRDSILKAIDSYEKSVRTVRAKGNNSLSEDQVDELAWYHWKIGVFSDRLKSIVDKNKPFFNQLRTSSSELLNADVLDDSAEGKKHREILDNIVKYVNTLEKVNSANQLGVILAENKDFNDFLNSENTAKYLYTMLGIDKDEFLKSMNELRDTYKMGSVAKKFSDRYEEFSKDPIKLIKNRQTIASKAEKRKQAKQAATRQQFAQEASVSEIVKASDEGNLNLDELEGMEAFPSDTSQLTPRQKAQEAKNIQATSRNAREAINNSNASEQAKKDAQTLLNGSYSVSENADELLDLEREAFQNPTALYDVEDPSMQALTPEEVQQVLALRRDEALDVLQQAKTLVEQAKGDLDSLSAEPKGKPKYSLGAELLSGQSKPEQQEQPEDIATGHDEVEQPTAINEQKPKATIDPIEVMKKVRGRHYADAWGAYNRRADKSVTFDVFRTLSGVIQEAYNLLASKHEVDDVKDAINATEKGQLDSIMGEGFTDSLVDELYNELTGNSTTPTETTKPQDEYLPTPSVNLDNVLLTAKVDGAKQEEELSKTLTAEEKRYWKPTVTELPIHAKTDSRPLYIEASSMKRADGTARFSKEQLERIEAIGEYLTKNGAYEAVDSGVCVPGATVRFFIDKSLCRQARATTNDPVILMEVDGKVVGDLGSRADAERSNQVGLIDFIDRAAAEFDANAENPDNKIYLSETSTIAKNMIGKVPYSTGRHTLNEIFTEDGQQRPFKLAIAMNDTKDSIILNGTAGRTKAQGQSEFDLSIMPPLTAAKGQPFLLLPTGNINDPNGMRKYRTVPVSMAPYSQRMDGTKFDKAVTSLLSLIPHRDGNSIMEVVQELRELLACKEVRISYSGDNVTIKVQPATVSEPRQIYKGNKNDTEGIIKAVKGSFLPIQVSRKYINSTYRDGSDYNTMMGELLMTNLPIGTTHTRSEWFIVNPIKADGTQIKAKAPKSLGFNPNAKESTDHNQQPVTQQSTQSFGEKFADSAQVIKSHHDQSPYEMRPVLMMMAKAPANTMVDVKVNGHHAQAIRIAGEGNFDGTSTDIVLVSCPFENKSFILYRTPMTNLGTEPRALDHMQIAFPETLYYDLFPGNMALHYEEAKFQEFAKKFVEEADYNGLFNHSIKDYAGMGRSANRDFSADVSGLAQKIFDNVAAKRADIESSQTIDTTQPQQTNEPISDDSMELPSLSEVSSAVAQRDEALKPTESPESRARKLGITSPQFLGLFKQLTPSQQEVILSKKKAAIPAIMSQLTKAFDAKTRKFDMKKVDEILSKQVKLRADDNAKVSFDLNSELRWLAKVLPQFSTSERLKLVNGLTKMDGSTAIYGMFTNGIIFLNSTHQTRGTTYHEAFHAVFNTLLDDNTAKSVIEAAKQKWGNLDDISLEEKLAEDFRQYVEWIEYATPFQKIWRNLKRFISKLKGKQSVLDTLYRDINRGKFKKKSVRQSDVTRESNELEQIKQKAIADGTFMKAPNGNPTNLNEKQWLQVRTKSFKEWFGDWENDSANASKVVDINGEPLVVYRATEIQKDGTIKTRYKAYYFTPSRSMAEQYSKDYEVPVHSFFLKANSINDIGNGLKPIIRSDGAKVPSRGLFEMPWSSEDVDIILSGAEAAYSSGEYLVHDSNQVKSATDNIGTFSTTNNDIRYREIDEAEVDLSIAEDNIQETLRQIEGLQHEEKYSTLEKVVDAVNDIVAHLGPNAPEGPGLRVDDGNLIIKKAINKKGDTYYLHKGIAHNKSSEISYRTTHRDKVKNALETALRNTDLFRRLHFSEVTDARGDKIYAVSLMGEKLDYTAMIAAAKRTLDKQIKEKEDAERILKELKYREEIEKHYASFDRLSAEEQSYVFDRGISREKWDEMSNEEKETLMRCRV